MKLAFVGPPAVGKDTVSNYIEQKYRLVHISSGDIVRQEHNLGELDRKNLQIIANKLRSEKGGDILVRMAFEKAPDNLILSGLRAIDEIVTFKKLGGIVIVITAPLENRYEFAKIRGRIGDDISIEAFKEIEKGEQINIDRNGQNVDKVISMADIEIVNDGTLDDLYRKCDEVIEKLKK